MDILKINQSKKLKEFNFKMDEIKSNDVLGQDVIKVHDFFAKSRKINRMSDVFPQTQKDDNDILS